MNRPLHRFTFATRPQSFGRRAVSIEELRARVNRRAANRQAAREIAVYMLLCIILPLAIGFTFEQIGGL